MNVDRLTVAKSGDLFTSVALKKVPTPLAGRGLGQRKKKLLPLGSPRETCAPSMQRLNHVSRRLWRGSKHHSVMPVTLIKKMEFNF